MSDRKRRDGIVDLGAVKANGNATEVEYKTDFQIGHTEEGLIIFAFRCGLVAASVTLAPEGAYALGENLCSAAAQIMPDPETLIERHKP